MASRAGVAPGYVRYVEEHPGVPDTASLRRLATALETSASTLLGGGVSQPPGLGQAAANAELREMDPDECRARLSGHGVGRVAVATDHGLAVVPVNYTVVDGAVVYRAAPGSVPALAAGKDVAFEVDHIDDALSMGWSVLVAGRAREVTDPAETQRLEKTMHTTPWAGGDRPLWVRVDPARLTGRRIEVP
ncbi:helix-turn-helix domain-containing protein [Streptomyces sp. 4N509B]|uniref:helix-turn-helix domain-containing protein n=1 Tax=Streptomyces sp. 4N509B TaxID=3457413 RepID=UPI003FD1FED9